MAGRGERPPEPAVRCSRSTQCDRPLHGRLCRAEVSGVARRSRQRIDDIHAHAGSCRIQPALQEATPMTFHESRSSRESRSVLSRHPSLPCESLFSAQTPDSQVVYYARGSRKSARAGARRDSARNAARTRRRAAVRPLPTTVDRNMARISRSNTRSGLRNGQ